MAQGLKRPEKHWANSVLEAVGGVEQGPALPRRASCPSCVEERLLCNPHSMQEVMQFFHKQSDSLSESTMPVQVSWHAVTTITLMNTTVPSMMWNIQYTETDLSATATDCPDSHFVAQQISRV